MKHFIFVAGLLAAASGGWAEQSLPSFSWELLYAGSWEESKNLFNRVDARLGLAPPGLLLRGQVLDRHTLNFELDHPLGDASLGGDPKGVTAASFGLYHKETGSRLLYGALEEWGLPARVRSPWIRSAPFPENHKPIMADLRTAASAGRKDEAYLYLSSPRLDLSPKIMARPAQARGFASAQIAADENLAPAFSLGLESFWGAGMEVLLEGFYTGAQLPPRKAAAWFSNPPPLPAREFRLGAAALQLNAPCFSFSSDWAWSETFAWGGGVYGNAGIRASPPLSGNGNPGPWHFSLAADGMSERYAGRDGASPGGGLRVAGKAEWKGPRSSLFRLNTAVRGPAIGEPLARSSSGVYYRFPAPPARGAAANSSLISEGQFPLRITRVSLNASRNGSDGGKIHDGLDGSLGLSLNLPPIALPAPLLSPLERKAKNPRPKIYPLGINLSFSIDELGSFGGAAGEAPSPYPFFPASQEFDSAKISGELLWSPGIFQLRTKWGYTAYERKDNRWDGSISAAARFKRGRISAKIAWPVFPDKWNATLAWRVEK